MECACTLARHPTMTQRTTPILAALAAALGLWLGTQARAASVTDAIACCDHADDPDSCWPLDNAADSSACDPASEWALCQVDAPLVLSCEPAALYCCASTAGVGWLDACEQYMPDTQCGGIVMGKVSP